MEQTNQTYWQDWAEKGTQNKMRAKDIGFSHLSSCGLKGEIYILDFWAAELDAEFVYV